MASACPSWPFTETMCLNEARAAGGRTARNSFGVCTLHITIFGWAVARSPINQFEAAVNIPSIFGDSAAIVHGVANGSPTNLKISRSGFLDRLSYVGTEFSCFRSLWRLGLGIMGSCMFVPRHAPLKILHRFLVGEVFPLLITSFHFFLSFSDSSLP